MGRDDYIAAVDVGGTKIAAARVSTGMEPQGVRISPTVTSSEEACFGALCRAIEAVLAEGPVAAIGVGTASFVDFRAGHVVASNHLPWRDFPLRDELAARFGFPVVVDNDATVACIAEHRFGAGRGAREMLMLTIGTGIGGGIIVRDHISRGFSGAAGEFGHVVIDRHGPPCPGNCPNRGCLEAFVSGRVLDERARLVCRERPASAFAAAAAAGEPPDGRLATRLACEGDPDANAIFTELGDMLGVGISSLVNIFNPELVVVGGGLAAAGDLLLEPARRTVAQRALRPHSREVRIVPAHFREHAGVIGAAALAVDEIVEPD
jgi:glucokinase